MAVERGGQEEQLHFQGVWRVYASSVQYFSEGKEGKRSIVKSKSGLHMRAKYNLNPITSRYVTQHNKYLHGWIIQTTSIGTIYTYKLKDIFIFNYQYESWSRDGELAPQPERVAHVPPQPEFPCSADPESL